MDPQPTPATTAEQPQPEQMTAQFTQQLVTLLKQPKVEVKYASLNAILQHTKSEQARQLFLQTQLFGLLIQSMKMQQLHKLCLSTLIHFSGHGPSAQKILAYIQPIVMDLRNSTGLPEQLGLLLLLNISKQQEFTRKLTDPTSQSPSLLLQLIYGFMESKPSRRWVIANIFVNISSHDIGRQYIATQKLYLGFLKYINDPKQALRLAVLRIVRNVAFLWETEEIVVDLLSKQNHVVDTLAIHVLVMVLKSKLVEDTGLVVELLRGTGYSSILDYDMEIEPELEKISTSKQKSINQIQICIDTLVILSNADFPKRKPQFLKDQLKKMISIVNFTEISEEFKDKLQALETFCFW